MLKKMQTFLLVISNAAGNQCTRVIIRQREGLPNTHDISAWTQPVLWQCRIFRPLQQLGFCSNLDTNASFLAEISVRSP